MPCIGCLVRRGIDEAVERVVESLRATARPVESADELRHVATIAADARIGRAVAAALERVGLDGVVTVEERPEPGVEASFAEGVQVENGFISPYMARDRHVRW